MSGIVAGITHLFQSVFEIIGGIISTIFGLFSTAVNSVLLAIQSVFSLAVDLLNSVIDLFGGIVGFLLGNLFTIALIAGAFFAYNRYQKGQGKTIGIKKSQ